MIKSMEKVDLHLSGTDPFLFCAHHLDKYPQGGQELDLDAAYLEGRNVGSDFVAKDGFRIYHGTEVPGFPVHPHRGFETITIATQGFIDHADSLGAAGRFGKGDVQWMTAGSGVQHSEMFPLLNSDKANTLEIFQIWLNLPAKDKMAPPAFKMLWNENIPTDKSIEGVSVKVVHGDYRNTSFHGAPPHSWAADLRNSVNIFLVEIAEGASFKLPKNTIETTRIIYFYKGEEMALGNSAEETQTVGVNHSLVVDSLVDLNIRSIKGVTCLLFLEGKPIAEPMVQYGPFVMNTKQEILNTIADYQKTQFGGWSWGRQDMVHSAIQGRFAKYPDGSLEYPDQK